MDESPPKFTTLLRRGWRKKCPHCGRGDLYERWMRLRDHCPVCGLKYLQNQGDIIGPCVAIDYLMRRKAGDLAWRS